MSVDLTRCICPKAGLCPLYRREVTDREHSLCSGINDPTNVSDAKRTERRTRWYERSNGIEVEDSKKVSLKWVSTADLVANSIILAGMLPPGVRGIIGVPRSGMVCASIIATHLHLPLWELTVSGPRLMSAGGRAKTLNPSGDSLALIDDTVYTGSAMNRAKKIVDGKVLQHLASNRLVAAAVYTRPDAKETVDLFVEELPSPHLLEWNILNNAPAYGGARNPLYKSGIATDLDGIICHDGKSGGKVGTPYLLPRMLPIRLIITGRTESMREATEAWLKSWGVRWHKLEMLPDDQMDPIAHKAKHYAASSCGFFLESCPTQARAIHEATNKPVICPATRQVWPAEILIHPRLVDTIQPPTFFQKAKNLLRDGLAHRKDRYRKVPLDIYEQRSQGCDSCDLFKDNHCTHTNCGCSMKGESKHLAALWWASKQCPKTPPVWLSWKEEEERAAATPLEENKDSLITKESILVVNQQQIKWAYGVTTCPPRRDTLLPQTLASLVRAGFDKPRIFVDGDEDSKAWREKFPHLTEFTLRYPSMRTFGNWVLALGELYIREPAADRYAIFQDDFVTYRNLRGYLDKCVYPDPPEEEMIRAREASRLPRGGGYWNLYTFPSNQKLAPKNDHDQGTKSGWYLSNQLGRGAVALVFSKQAVVTLLSNYRFIERPQDATRGHKAIDGGIVEAFKRSDWTEFVHHPSLVQHTGAVTTISGNPPHKQAISFLGETFDAVKLLKGV